MNQSTGIYICSGCGIGEAVHTEVLPDRLTKRFPLAVCRIHPALCSGNGIRLIEEDLINNRLNGIVIGACSPRVRNCLFDFDPDLIVEWVNLREQVAWCHDRGSEDTVKLAEDMLAMGITRITKISLPIPLVPEKTEDTILVVGGGITGITAALEGARAGYAVMLVEKEPRLGGWMVHLHKQLPFGQPFLEPIDPIIDHKIRELNADPLISVHTSTLIESISGQPGDFAIEIRTNGVTESIKAGSIVWATGWQPYDPYLLDALGYGRFSAVVTQIDLEKRAREGTLTQLLASGHEDGVLFIQCAGSRDPGHLPYCSNYCCATTLKQTTYLRQAFPDMPVYVVYKDLRTPGHLEQFYQSMQQDAMLFLTKGEIAGISGNGKLLEVKVNDTFLGANILLTVNLVVLATGMTPSQNTDLNLTYRQGKGLPALKYEFPDSHFICFPYETRRTGIYAAGTARAPMHSAACMDDAAGAMLKAIQCIECTKRGEAVHPRSGDRSYPDLYMLRCTDCKRCTEECPFGAYDETPKGTPLPHPTRCRRCGICLGACPERIINFSDFSIESVSAMIKSISMPDEFEEKPRILAFVCENDAYPAFDMAGVKRLRYDPAIRIIPVRCIGSVNKIWITDALSKGFDGILLFGCKPGEDYQCHFILGSELTQKRAENFQEALQTMMLEPERIRMEVLEITDCDKIPGIIEDFMQTMTRIGPNPFKSL